MMGEKELKYPATPEKGDVSGLLMRPAQASHLLVLGHGASTNMRHATLKAIARALADAGIATFRYNFPYAEHGTGRDRPRGGRRGARGRPRPPLPGRGPLLRRAHDLHRCLGIAAGRRAGARLLLLPAPAAR